MMKRLVFLLLSLCMGFSLTACGGNPNPSGGGKAVHATAQTAVAKEQEPERRILVAYFSRSGTTEVIANTIHRQVGGDLFKIETMKEYPAAYRETTAAAKAEKEKNERPALKQPLPDLKEYDVIFVGYPIWWHTAPMAVFTFLESYDLSGKIIIPFCTSGGSGIEESMADIEKLAAQAALMEGLTANRAADVEPWLKRIGFSR